MPRKRLTFADLLEKTGLRPSELAQRAEISRNTIYELKKGTWEVKPWTAKAIAKAMGYPIEAVLDACAESRRQAGH